MEMTASIAEIVIEDLRNCCRVCLDEPHRAQMVDMNIIFDEEAQLTYYDCYEICTKDDLRLTGEGEPHTICKHCGVELQWAYNFYKKVALANEQLKNVQTIEYRESENDDHTAEDDKAVHESGVSAQMSLCSDLEMEESGEQQSVSEVNILKSSATKMHKRVQHGVRRQRHSGPFNCQFCQKVFRNHSHMLKHQVIHLEDRPHFPCNTCDRFYLTKQALKVHVNTQHKKSGSKCSICGKVFAVAKALEIHTRYHNGLFPFKCNQCDRKFAQRSHLTVHEQVQHSSARFLCKFPSCGKMFTSSSTLRNHECTHTEMPFECKICHQGFPARYKLRLHAQRKHKVELTLEQLEAMRKFHIMRSKRVLAKLNAVHHEKQDENQQQQQQQQEQEHL